jgi:Holliday junction resolvase RusA-like endonuclease
MTFLNNIKRFIVPGNPVPLARARLCHKRFFDSQHLEKLNAGLIIRNQLGMFTPFENVPLSIDFLFVMPIPQCSQKRHAKYLDSYHIYRPDTDNMIKFYLDTCNNVLYKDDCIIAKISAIKIYGDEPRTEFTIRELGEING